MLTKSWINAWRVCAPFLCLCIDVHQNWPLFHSNYLKLNIMSLSARAWSERLSLLIFISVVFIEFSCFAAPWRNLHVQSFCVYACVVPAFDIWMSLCIQSSSYSIYLLQCTGHEMVHEATRPAPDWNTGHVKAQLSWAHCRHFVSKRNV